MKTHPVFLSFFRLSVLSTQSYGYQAAKVLSPCAKKHLDGARLQQAGYGGEGGIRTRRTWGRGSPMWGARREE